MTWLSALKIHHLIALVFWMATGFYLLWFLRDSGIERDLFRNTEEDKQAYLLVIGTWLVVLGALLLCLGQLATGGPLLTGGISTLIGKSWLDHSTQKTITTAQIASNTTIATTKTTTAMGASTTPAPNASKPKPKPNNNKPATSLMGGGEGK